MASLDEWAEIRLATLLSGGNPDELEERARQRGVSAEVVREGFRRAIALVETEQPFEVYEATPPGKVDLRVFDQDEVWIDVLRQTHKIADPDDQTDEYLINLIRFLRVEVDGLCRNYARSRDRAMPRSSIEWLEGTVLMRALRAECERRGLPAR